MSQFSEQKTLDANIQKSTSEVYLSQNITENCKTQILFETEFANISEVTINAESKRAIYPSTISGINEVFIPISGTAILTSEDSLAQISLGSILVTEDLDSVVQLKVLEEFTLLTFNMPIGLPKNESEGKRVSIRSIIDSHQIFSRGSVEIEISSIPKNESVYLERDTNNSIFYEYIASGSIKFDTQKSSQIFDTSEYHEISGDNLITSHQAIENNTVLVLITFTENSVLLDWHEEYIKKAEEIEIKDGYTSDHCSRIEYLAVKTGKKLQSSPEKLRNLSCAGFFHDLGKLKVPLEILQKEGSLTEKEWDIIKQHPTWGKEILLEETSVGLFVKTSSTCATTIIEQHHERMDGSGYPFGLKGDEIHTESYIIGVVDTYDAMTTDRPYRKGLSHEIAVAELEKLRGRQFPDYVVDAFFSVISEARANDIAE